MTSSPALPLDAPRRGLALRYRPRRFAELTGQRHAAAILGRMIARGEVPRQVLLSGGSGLGKTTVGRIFAAALLCTTDLAARDGGDACGHCDACRDVTAAVPSHPDVIELDAASNGGKDEIRDIAAKANLSPMRGRFKVYVIDEVHAISGAGAQAFLKLLEEPPAHVVFVLCTTNPEKLSSGAGGAGTVRGRCLELELVRPSDAELTGNLQRIAAAEGFVLPEHVAAQVLVATDPTLGVRGTVMTLEKVAARLAEDGELGADELATLLGTVSADALAELTDAIGAGRRADALASLDVLRGRASDQTVRTALLRWSRDVLRTALSGAGPVGADVALARFELLAGLPPADHWTDVAVVKMASPCTDDTQRAAVVTDAGDVLAQLTEQVATARKAVEVMRQMNRNGAAASASSRTPTASSTADQAGPAAPRSAPAPDAVFAGGPPAGDGPDFGAPVAPAVTRPAAAQSQPPLPPEPYDDAPPPPDEPYDEMPPPPEFSGGAPDPARARGRKSAPANRRGGRTPGSEAAGSPKRKALLGRVATHDPDMARLLAACDVSFPAGRVKIVPPDETTGRALGSAERTRLLLTAAKAAGASRVTVEKV